MSRSFPINTYFRLRWIRPVVSSPRMNRIRVLLFLLLGLAASFACRAATRLVLADTPTPPTPTATFLPPTPTFAASCPGEMDSILQAANQPTYTTGNFPNVDTGNNLDIQLVTYTVNGDLLSDPHLESVPDNLKKYQSDFSTQQKAWKLFTDPYSGGPTQDHCRISGDNRWSGRYFGACRTDPYRP